MKITLETLEKVRRSKKVSRATMELKGYELIEELFVDSSGFGAPDEPALTYQQLLTRLRELVTEHGPLYSTITSVGQFQVYLGLFKKVWKASCKRIGNNTIKYTDRHGVEHIRLHDTDIVSYHPDGTMTIDSGGWQTRTTKDRINEYLPDHVTLYQKNFTWFLDVRSVDGEHMETVPFEDGMTVPSVKASADGAQVDRIAA